MSNCLDIQMKPRPFVELNKRTKVCIVVQAQKGWGVTYTPTHICASKGSTVDMHCTYRYPSKIEGQRTVVEKTFWFTKLSKSDPLDLEEDSEYAGRVQYHCDGNECTLTLTDLRHSDSAEYKFRFITNHSKGKFTGVPGVILTVTALQVQVTRITVNQSHSEAELKCLSSCSSNDDISYVWFKNGEKIMEEGTSVYSGQFNPGDNVSCALKGYEDSPSPTLYAPIVPSVLVTPSGDIMEGSSVNLTCSGDANISVNYTWYKKNVNQDLQPLSKEPQLVVNSIQSSDSGEYYCTTENQLGKSTSEYIFIDVKYAPKIPSVSVSPSGEIVEGTSVTLTCSSDANPAANYTWYKENQTLFHGSEGIYNFTSISSEDRAMYFCKSENQYGQINSSSFLIDVLYAPKILSVSVSPSGEIVEGSSVNLTCSSDANPAANYTWYKENQTLFHGSEGIYNFMSISSEDRAIASKKPKTVETMDNSAPTQPAEQQDDLNYATVHFTKKEADPLYSNIRPAQPQRHKEEEEMNGVVYATVKINSGSEAPRNGSQETEEDPAALYSTVNKTPK
ncbi:B-cell receptor CD22-like [Scomber scombrus]|uniref:B-cell receptor CD22-like n=1 Tax=Scomber scombrus TaxID=13677 RepID=UPI002DD95B2F|nr:B-cell receptor CD22-like [Scomber scombrus]